MIKRSLGAAALNLNTKVRGGELARGTRLCAHLSHHQANLADHPETTPATYHSPLCLLMS